MLAREGLRDRFAGALEHASLVYVHAAAGYGKTSLIESALASRAEPVARFVAAPWDAGAFVEPLVEAVRAIRPDFGRRVLALHDVEGDAARIGAAFAADLRHVDDAAIIVVDDAHVLAEPFAAFVRGALHALPPRVRLVVASRRPPPSDITGLVARGRVTLFDANDLRFSPSEIGVLAAAFGQSLGRVQLEQLDRRMDGWPAGVALALAAGNEEAFAHRSADALRAFLLDHAIADLASGHREALETFVVHEVVAGDLLDVRSRRAFEELAASGAMIAPWHDGFRVHPMLREAIVERIARRDGPAALRHAHAAAARWYAGTHRMGPALFHLSRSGDAALTREVLRRCGADAIVAGLGTPLGEALAAVGADALGDPALIAFLTGWSLKQDGALAARERFAEALVGAERAGDDELAFAARVQVVEVDLGRGVAVAERTLDELVEGGRRLGAGAHAEAEIRAGWSAAIAGRFPDALAFAERAALAGGPLQRAAVVPLRAYALTVLGRFDDAERDMVALIEGLHDSDDLVARTRMLVWSARLALLRGSLDEAWADASEAWRTGADLVPRAERAAMGIALAEAATAAGAPDVVQAAIETATTYADAAWYERDRRRFPAQARLYAARRTFLVEGPAAAARDLAGTDGAAPACQQVALIAERAAYARLAGAAPGRGELRRAFDLGAAATASDAADAVALAEAFRLLALLEPALPEPPRSDTSPFAPLLRRRFARPLAGFHARLEAQIRLPGSGLAAAAPLRAARLTERENEILALLAEGLTNKEIAQRLVLGTRTVETHVARTLGKLGVSSRSRAVAAYLRSSTDGPGAGRSLRSVHAEP